MTTMEDLHKVAGEYFAAKKHLEDARTRLNRAMDSWDRLVNEVGETNPQLLERYYALRKKEEEEKE